jgi:hypothetical protein
MVLLVVGLALRLREARSCQGDHRGDDKTDLHGGLSFGSGQDRQACRDDARSSYGYQLIGARSLH